jgi:hypothetical protein
VGIAPGALSNTTYAVSMLLDETDTPHLVYTDVPHRQVRYATRRNGKWQIEVVDRVKQESYPDRDGIALDELGNPYVSFFDPGEGALKVAHRSNGRWYVEVLSRDFSGFTSSLQIHDRTLWLAYSDEQNACLKVAHRQLDELKSIPVPPRYTTAKGTSK